MVKAASLVRKGFFPRELPPPFTTEKFADAYEADSPAFTLGKDWTEPTRHNLARARGFRRPLAIPNARSFLKLAQVVEQLWSDIDTHCKAQELSVSRPVVRTNGQRAVEPRTRFGQRPRLRPKLWRGKRYLLNSDVTQLYPSLYTHALPWVLHGKAFAKANINKTPAEALDRALREASNGQTIGIPIGPDTSFVVAEVVLTAVDDILTDQFPSFSGIRYLDDYEAAFQSRSEAEEALGHLEAALSEFELSINPFKTEIVELPQPFDATWSHEINAFPIRRDTAARTLHDVIALFSRAAELARRHPGPLKYALQKTRDIQVNAATWGPFQSLVWFAVSSEPTTMPAALDVLTSKAEEMGYEVDKSGAAEVLEPLVATNAPLRNGNEVAWAVWAAIVLGLELSSEAANAVSKMEDDIVALLALHASATGAMYGDSLDLVFWEDLIDSEDALRGPHWLLAYEATRQKWLTGAISQVDKHDFFNTLLQRDVAFYDPDPQRIRFTGPAGPLPGGQVPDDYV
jgi:hypothetical protein